MGTQFIQVSWLSIVAALVLTEVVELVVALFILRAVPLKRKLVTVLIMNLVTNPILNVVLVSVVSAVSYPTTLYFTVLGVGEFLVWFIEAFIMKAAFKIEWSEALLASFLLNATSVLAGLLAWTL